MECDHFQACCNKQIARYAYQTMAHFIIIIVNRQYNLQQRQLMMMNNITAQLIDYALTRFSPRERKSEELRSDIFQCLSMSAARVRCAYSHAIPSSMLNTVSLLVKKSCIALQIIHCSVYAMLQCVARSTTLAHQVVAFQSAIQSIVSVGIAKSHALVSHRVIFVKIKTEGL